MGKLNNLKCDPHKSVLYQPNNTKQQADLNLINTGAEPIMVKMKSTRPGLYKMRPVFGLVPANGNLKIKLIFKGLKKDQKCPPADRYTIVSSLAPSTTTKVDKMWKQHKYREKMVSGEVTKKKIHILFAGVNDHDPLPDSGSDKSAKAKGTVKKGKGTVDTPAQAAAKPVLVMFRNQAAPDSDDDDDSEDEEDKSKDGQKKSAEPAAAKSAETAAKPGEQLPESKSTLSVDQVAAANAQCATPTTAPIFAPKQPSKEPAPPSDPAGGKPAPPSPSQPQQGSVFATGNNGAGQGSVFVTGGPGGPGGAPAGGAAPTPAPTNAVDPSTGRPASQFITK